MWKTLIIKNKDVNNMWKNRHFIEYIQQTSPKNIMKGNFKNCKVEHSPRFNIMTAEILRHLPRKAIVKMINLTVSYSYDTTSSWEIAEVIRYQSLTSCPRYDIIY